MTQSYPHIHPSYTRALPFWVKWEDAATGEDAVKAKKETYLPRLFGQEPEEYEQYLRLAVYYNATGRTVDALSSAHLRREPLLSLGKLESLKERACHNQTLEELIAQASRKLWTVGRCGLLGEIDTDSNPQLYLYTAQSIVNWRFTDDVLQFVILAECYEAPSKDSPYVYESRMQYRICELVEGQYVQRVQRLVKGADGKEAWVDVPELEEHPTYAGGSPLDFIPFTFLNYESENGDIGGSPIVDLANLNLKHYINYADLEHTVHLVACPFLLIIGLEEEKRPKKMPVGSSLTLYLEQGGSAAYVSVSGDGIPQIRDSLTLKEDQMARLGGSFLRAQKREAETEESLRIQQSGESSVLIKIRHVLNKGFTAAIRMLARWMGYDEESISVTTSDEFFDVSVSIQEMEFLFKLYQSNNIDLKTFLESLQGGGLLKKEWVTSLLERQAQGVKQNGTQESVRDSAGPSDRPVLQSQGQPVGA